MTLCFGDSPASYWNMDGAWADLIWKTLNGLLSSAIYIMVPRFHSIVMKGDSMGGHHRGLSRMHPDRSSCLNMSVNASMGWQISGDSWPAFCKTFCMVPPEMHRWFCIGLPKMHGLTCLPCFFFSKETASIFLLLRLKEFLIRNIWLSLNVNNLYVVSCPRWSFDFFVGKYCNTIWFCHSLWSPWNPSLNHILFS